MGSKDSHALKLVDSTGASFGLGAVDKNYDEMARAAMNSSADAARERALHGKQAKGQGQEDIATVDFGKGDGASAGDGDEDDYVDPDDD